MPVKYMYQDRRLVGLIWTEDDKKAYAFIAGTVLLACLITGVIWWKVYRPTMGTRPVMGLCHTCGGKT